MYRRIGAPTQAQKCGAVMRISMTQHKRKSRPKAARSCSRWELVLAELEPLHPVLLPGWRWRRGFGLSDLLDPGQLLGRRAQQLLGLFLVAELRRQLLDLLDPPRRLR